MTKADALMLDFADAFERELIGQGAVRRTVQESLDAGLALMQRFSLEVKI
jgi:V/A-type H+-transporting ATPase subunit B